MDSGGCELLWLLIFHVARSFMSLCVWHSSLIETCLQDSFPSEEGFVVLLTELC